VRRRVFFVFCSSLLFFWLLFFIPGISYGQNYRTHKEELAQIASMAKWRLGPFQISPGIQFREIGYDGNVYNRRKDDHPVSDYTATISPQLNLFFLYRGWLIFSFLENPEYVFYGKEKRERAFNNSYSPSLRLLLFQRFVLSGNYQFQRTKVRTSSEFDLRVEEESEGYNAGIFFETPRGTSIGFSGAKKRLTYKNITLRGEEIDFSRILNREERSGQVELNYRVFSGSLFFMKLGYSEYDFLHVESHWKNSFSFQASGGLRLPYSGKTRGFVSIGYRMLTPRRTWIAGFQGLIANMSLEYRLKRLVFRLQYGRDCNFSYEANNVFYLENGVRAGLSLYLTSFLRLDYYYAYTQLDYPRLVPVWFSDGRYEEIKRKDLNHTQTAGFVFKILKDTGIGLMFNFFDRDSNYVWEGRRERWFVGAYFTQDF
jgi:hypothetical protein